MLEAGRYEVENQYARAVRREGNPPARQLIDDVFEVCDRKWRGIGMIPDSGYRLRPDYRDFDAERRFAVEGIQVAESKVCISGLILQGLKKPHDCPAFGKTCTPQTPLGATMVSAEGACAAYYHYGRYREAAAACRARCRRRPCRKEERQSMSERPADRSTSSSCSCPLPMVDYDHVLLGHGSGGS